VALATLDLLEREDAVGRVQALAPKFENAVHSLKGCRHLTDIRNFGLAAGFSIESVAGEPARRPYEIAMAMWNKGFYVRYGGDTIQLAPPFVADEKDIWHMVEALGETLNQTN
jgi:beta-alanine--pyruvate transaminase